ncbi:pyridoxamine 5'-phosphate oxidase family protein [Nitrosophilus alvini]|uniref:pyridoxamine 5'-phosphate oxidase family protein n=1 Tax=Nitrosophilus alvini TaxID=2714855 RepID=UPI00190A4B30|nr:pyridoxamine 5'-phosphate oxidase family protein [Nitrosophilus alvini]
MGKQYGSLKQKDVDFINAQKIFFLASCSLEEVNLSPKGYESIKVLDSNTLLYLDYPGSGNRTARDIENDGEITLMFCSFEGKPKILRAFCKGELIEKKDAQFSELLKHFDADESLTRRLIKFHIYAVETSCGFGVPLMKYIGRRSELENWAVKKRDTGELEKYIEEHKTPPNLKNLGNVTEI